VSLGELASRARIQELEIEIARTQKVLGTLIQWIAQSAGSPISVANAETLLKELTRRIAKEKP